MNSTIFIWCAHKQDSRVIFLQSHHCAHVFTYVMPWSVPNMLLCPLVFNLQARALQDPGDNISARWKGAPACIYWPSLPISTVLAFAVTLANRTAASPWLTRTTDKIWMHESSAGRKEKEKNQEPRSGSQGILFNHGWGRRVQLPVISKPGLMRFRTLHKDKRGLAVWWKWDFNSSLSSLNFPQSKTYILTCIMQ